MHTSSTRIRLTNYLPFTIITRTYYLPTVTTSSLIPPILFELNRQMGNIVMFLMTSISISTTALFTFGFDIYVLWFSHQFQWAELDQGSYHEPRALSPLGLDALRFGINSRDYSRP
jgi:hypothetical protein